MRFKRVENDLTVEFCRKYRAIWWSFEFLFLFLYLIFLFFLSFNLFCICFWSFASNWWCDLLCCLQRPKPNERHSQLASCAGTPEYWTHSTRKSSWGKQNELYFCFLSFSFCHKTWLSLRNLSERCGCDFPTNSMKSTSMWRLISWKINGNL